MHRIEAGLVMREGMLLGGTLTNSEVWHGVSDKILSDLEKVDEYFLKKLLNSHSKVCKESLAHGLPNEFVFRGTSFCKTLVKRHFFRRLQFLSDLSLIHI